jgi:hypothetical protein
VLPMFVSSSVATGLSTKRERETPSSSRFYFLIVVRPTGSGAHPLGGDGSGTPPPPLPSASLIHTKILEMGPESRNPTKILVVQKMHSRRWDPVRRTLVAAEALSKAASEFAAVLAKGAAVTSEAEQYRRLAR